MKILWISHIVPYPPKGGLLQRSHNLLRQISKKHEVHLVTLNQKKILPTTELLDEAISKLKELCYRINVFDIKSDLSKYNWGTMVVNNYFSKFPYDVNWLSNDQMMSFMSMLSKNDKYDLVHIDTLGMYPYCVPFLNVPIVLNHHNIESQMMSKRSEFEKNTFKRYYTAKEAIKLQTYEKRICPRCDMNIVVSDLDSSRMKNNIKDINIAVVPNGVDDKYFTPNTGSDIKREGLIFAGGMSFYPNREAMLYFISEIWPLLKTDYPNIPVTIIGRDPPKELLNISLWSNISPKGFVDDVRPYFDSAKIYICPIFNGGGTRLKILDALAMAKPLVATEFAVEGLDLVAGKHYLPANNASEFVNQIKKLLNDDNLRNYMGMEGRKFIEERYSWEIIGNKLNNVYYETITKYNNKHNR